MNNDTAARHISFEAFAAWLGPASQEPHGIRLARRREDASVHLATDADHLMCNRAVLWPAAAGDPGASLDWALEAMDSAGVSRFLVQFRADDHGAATARALQQVGLVPFHRDWVELVRDARPVAAAEARGLRIESAQPPHAPALGRLGCEAFGVPEAMAPLFEGLVGEGSEWRVFVALDGDTPVAMGGLFVSGAVGYLGFGATAESHRGRGAQRALIAARIEAARQLGCFAMMSETGEQVEGERNTSWLNLERAGFVPSHRLRNYTRPGVTW